MNHVSSLDPNHVNEAAHLDWDMANKALINGDSELAWLHLKQALTRLSSMEEINNRLDALLVSVSLDFSNLCFALGKGFNPSVSYLKKAEAASERLGDLRSKALIFMHLGRFYCFFGAIQDALHFLEKGKTEVENLGDEDILNRSAEFLGLFYHIQGLYIESLPHFERASKIYESWSRGMVVVNPSGPIYLALCYTDLGRFHQAIGTMDYYRRLALERSDLSLATTMRAVLGMALLMINQKKEASYHLTIALQESKKAKNDWAYYFATGCLSYHEFLEGRIQESRKLLVENVRHVKRSGLIHATSPLALEHHYELTKSGLGLIPGFNYHEELKMHLNGYNIRFEGVALRLQAIDSALKGGDLGAIEADLKKSETLLQRTGDPIQLAKTRLELARLKLKENDKETACVYAKKAWHGFSGYGDVFFPDVLRYLLDVNNPEQITLERSDELAEKFMSMIQDLIPSADPEELLARVVNVTNRFFGAERGGLFWFGRNKYRKKPVLLGASNLTLNDVFSKEFRSNLSLVVQSFREKQPHVVRPEGEDHWPHRARSILCLPFNVEGQTLGVLYHDNSYFKDCFDYLEEPMLIRLGVSLGAYINHIFKFSQDMERLAFEKIHLNERSERTKIVAESKAMKKVLAQVDRVASSDGTVLILGETGVGKELLAHRIHELNRRHQASFIIVDSTTIPENLVESELFGYEKGAFTGADRRKTGRLELANGGTLFIDEIGEISKSIQAKLLRVLEKKTLLRLGGSQAISSDFRLVVATNRDLAAEVTAGRFREDLYYRLNVVPITLPPLRERIEDVPLLAEYFLEKYAVKYNRSFIRNEIDSEDEARLMAYHWPGNVRELQNIIERAVLLSDGETLELGLPVEGTWNVGRLYNDHPSMEELQRRYIIYALEQSHGKIGGPGGAAEFLKMKRTTLQKRMKKIGIVNPKAKKTNHRSNTK